MTKEPHVVVVHCMGLFVGIALSQVHFVVLMGKVPQNHQLCVHVLVTASFQQKDPVDSFDH